MNAITPVVVVDDTTRNAAKNAQQAAQKSRGRDDGANVPVDTRQGTKALQLESLPDIKWRCAHCHAAFQELRAFRVNGTVEMDLLCHRCGKTSRVVRQSAQD